MLWSLVGVQVVLWSLVGVQIAAWAPMSRPNVRKNVIAGLVAGPMPSAMMSLAAIYVARVIDVGAVALSSVNVIAVVLPSSFLTVTVVLAVERS